MKSKLRVIRVAPASSIGTRIDSNPDSVFGVENVGVVKRFTVFQRLIAVVLEIAFEGLFAEPISSIGVLRRRFDIAQCIPQRGVDRVEIPRRR